MSTLHAPKSIRTLTLMVEYQETPPLSCLRFSLFNNQNNTDMVPLESSHVQLNDATLTTFSKLYDHFHKAEKHVPFLSDEKKLDLKKKGLQLFETILPRSIKKAIWQGHNQNSYLQIVSNTTAIPWELMVPQAPKEAPEQGEGTFLCDTHYLSQIPMGSMHEDTGFSPKKLGILAFGDDLPRITAEEEMLRELAGHQFQIVSIKPSLVGLNQALSQGNLDIIHFCCHTEFPAQESQSQTPDLYDSPGIALESGELWTLDHLNGAARAFGKAQPLIFFNSCFSNRVIRDLAGLTSWPQAFLYHGARAVIGANWQVKDKTAFNFAKAFYNSFLQGISLGEAVFNARQHADKNRGTSWLAYSCYGNPQLTLHTNTVKDFPNLDQLPAENCSHQPSHLSFRQSATLKDRESITPSQRPHSHNSIPQVTWGSAEFDILMTLAAVREPVTPTMIRLFSGRNNTEVRSALNNLSSYLHQEEALDGCSKPVKAYEFANEANREAFFAMWDQDQLEQQLSRIHQSIVEALEA